MGFFDRFAGKPAPAAGATPAVNTNEAPASPVSGRLLAAREKLDAKDLAGAVAIYEEVLATAGDRADVLVTISGDLGATGHIAQIAELVAPHYDATRHGPATGLNLLQAYLSLRDADAAQHVLDILFSLNRPELEERLNGFSNAIAELMTHGSVQGVPHVEPAHTQAAASHAAAPTEAAVALVTISRPIWSYGLESLEGLLPEKSGKLRRVAFTQFSLPGAYADLEAATHKPEDELARLSRAIPLWFAETFYFSPLYTSIAALSCIHTPDGVRRPAILPVDWTVENLRKLADTTEGGLDYIFSGNLKREGAEYVLVMKVWEVKKMRERKQISVRWTAANADAELVKLHEYVRAFMEWAPYTAGSSLPYSAPSAPHVWLEATGALLCLFLAEKQLLPKEQLPPLPPVFDALAPHTFSPPASSLAWLSLRSRARSFGLEPVLAEVMTSSHPLVAKAKAVLGS